jgi:hypothetical protein
MLWVARVAGQIFAGIAGAQDLDSLITGGLC